MSAPDPDLENAILTALRRAGEPVREAVLYERVTAAGHPADPEAFLGEVSRLETLGHLHVAFDHESRSPDPEPFEARFLRVVR